MKYKTFKIFYLKIFPSEFCLLMYTYMYETEKKSKVLFLHAMIKSDFLKYMMLSYSSKSMCFLISEKFCRLPGPEG